MKTSTHFRSSSLLYLFWILQPLILWAMGACQIQLAGSRGWDSHLVRFFVWAAALHVILIGPLTQFAYPELKKIKNRYLGILLFFVLVALPLLSFGNYVSHVTHAGALFDLVVPTLILVFLAVYFFDANENVAVLSLGLSSALYFQWFIISDILGPFKTTYQLVPKSDLFYWVRTCLMVFTIALVLWKNGRKVVVTSKDKAKDEIVPLILWMFVGGILYFGLPWVLSVFEKDTILLLNVTHFSFCLIPVWILLETKNVKGLQWAIAMLFAVKALGTMVLQPATFFNMSWTAFDLVTCVVMVVSLLRKDSLGVSLPVSLIGD